LDKLARQFSALELDRVQRRMVAVPHCAGCCTCSWADLPDRFNPDSSRQHL